MDICKYIKLLLSVCIVRYYYYTQNNYLLSLLYHFSHIIIYIFLMTHTYHYIILLYPIDPLSQPLHYNTSYYLHIYIICIHRSLLALLFIQFFPSQTINKEIIYIILGELDNNVACVFLIRIDCLFPFFARFVTNI